MSLFGVILVRIIPHLDWIQRDTPYLSLFRRKKTLVSGNTDDEKNLHPGSCNLFKLIFQRYYLFLFSFFCFFCILVFFLFLCVCFLKLKIYILIHIPLCGRVSDKNVFTRPISRNNTIFGVNPNAGKYGPE